MSEIIVWEAKRNIERKFPVYILPFKDFLLKCPFILIQSPTKEEVSKNKGLIRDKSDIPIILSAIQAKVDFFVTGDKDIIDEISNIKRGISFLTPSVFLKKVMGWKSGELEAVIHRTWLNFNK